MLNQDHMESISHESPTLFVDLSPRSALVLGPDSAAERPALFRDRTLGQCLHVHASHYSVFPRPLKSAALSPVYLPRLISRDFDLVTCFCLELVLLVLASHEGLLGRLTSVYTRVAHRAHCDAHLM